MIMYIQHKLNEYKAYATQFDDKCNNEISVVRGSSLNSYQNTSQYYGIF